MGKGGLKVLAMGAVLALLTACGGEASAVRPVYPAQPGGYTPAQQPSAPADQCGASALQGLIGQPRTEIPVPVDISNRRVTCTQCALTEDLRPERLNILFDRDTGRVERVYCG